MRTQELALQYHTLDTRVSMLSDTVANSLVRVTERASATASAGGATVNSRQRERQPARHDHIRSLQSVSRRALSHRRRLHARHRHPAPGVPHPRESSGRAAGGTHPGGRHSSRPAARQRERADACERGGRGNAHQRISPVRASLGATAATTPGSSLAHALEAPLRKGAGGRHTPSQGRLFDSTHPTPTMTSSSSRSRSQGEEDRSQPSSSSGLPPPVPTKSTKEETPTQQSMQEPKRPPPPTALRPAPTRPCWVVAAPSDSALSYRASCRCPTRQERADSPQRRRASREEKEEEQASAAEPRRQSLPGAWVPPVSDLLSASTDIDNTAATRTVEKQQRPQDEGRNSPRDDRPSAASGIVEGGIASSGERADPPQASAHRFDDWDDDERTTATGAKTPRWIFPWAATATTAATRFCRWTRRPQRQRGQTREGGGGSGITRPKRPPSRGCPARHAAQGLPGRH
ncbi:serine/arginine repetitive matrix protein 1-like [Bactrocera neohumeralis]|uniref:serine/arginine repetitive matrix protein 1-like n=1 Tax=Bactrocera neohumeralis TaxID=98809 RepID=UPI002166059F|nr:serine/arginine repetitive matrix protein 1-like [Bactrocera neohumeralis]